MAKNRKGMKKTPKKGGKESRVGSKKLFKGSNKIKKFISKQKCRLGFNELSPNEMPTPSTSRVPTAPSSFGSAENSPITRRLTKTNTNVMEKFKNNHMVPNMGFKRRKIATKNDSTTVSMKVNFANSKISDKKTHMHSLKGQVCKERENDSDGVKSQAIQETNNVINVSCKENKTDKESTILLDDSMDEYNDNVDNTDSSRIDVTKDPELQTVSQQSCTKKLVPATPPPPQWQGQLHAPELNTPASLHPAASPAAPTSSGTPDPSLCKGTSIGGSGGDGGSAEAKNDKNNDPIEELGQEMLNFVTDKAFDNPVPDTPKTLVKRGDPFRDILKISSHESEKESDETEDDVIVIDDDFEVIDEDDDLAIVGEVSGNRDVKPNQKPLTTSNLQAITERYQQPPSQDFIGFEISKTPVKPSFVQATQEGARQLKQKWKVMRKKEKKRKNIGGSNVNTLPLPKSGGPSKNLLVGPSLLTDSQRRGPSNPQNRKTPKPVKAGDQRVGDWTCSCGQYNKQWRNKCTKCNSRGGEDLPPLIQNEGPTSIVPLNQQAEKSGLRPIVIDGSNVAMAHGLNTNFSAKGIQICIQFFKKRGHAEIKAFMPQIRQGADPELLDKLYKDGHIVFTPSRKLHDGTNVISYDDSMFIEYAHELGGVIVSRDNFKDVMKTKPEWRETIESRLLMPTFAGDYLMFPPDPLGRGGPSLDQFLKF